MAVGWLLKWWFSSSWNCIITRGVKLGRQASCWASCWGSNVLHLVGAVVCSLFRTIRSITTGHIQWNYITDNSGDWHWLLFTHLSWAASVWVTYNNATSTTHRVVFVCWLVCLFFNPLKQIWKHLIGNFLKVLKNQAIWSEKSL